MKLKLEDDPGFSVKLKEGSSKKDLYSVMEYVLKNKKVANVQMQIILEEVSKSNKSKKKNKTKLSKR